MKTIYFFVDNGATVVPHRHAALSEAKVLGADHFGRNLPFEARRIREMGAYDSQEEADEAADFFHKANSADAPMNP